MQAELGRLEGDQIPRPHSAFLKALSDPEHLKKMISLPNCLGKLEPVGKSPQECGVQLLARKHLLIGPRFRGQL